MFAKLIIYRAFIESDLEVPKRLAQPVHEMYFNPQHEEFQPRTIWSLSNAFTSAFKELVPIPQFRATAKLGGFLTARGRLVSIARFPLVSGLIVATLGALEALEQSGNNGAALLRRHVTGDWGELDEHDRQENEFSVSRDLRILSAYTLSTGEKLWIITEADRSATTLLLPSEY